jgi:succinate dehydrogenase / fumarate reductase membrane anchor subunit
MEQNSKYLRSNLKRVRGLGSAHEGTHHFWLERISALALVPLSAWFVVQLVGLLIRADHDAVVVWIRQPISALLLGLLISMLWLHSRLGVQVIIEDYVHAKAKKFTLLIINSAAHHIFGAASLMAIIHLHFVGI